MRFETIAIHAGDRPDVTSGAISVPIHQTSTFVFEDVRKTRGWDYSRTANPTRKVLEDTIAQLEGGKAGFAFATGNLHDLHCAMLYNCHHQQYQSSS